MLEYTLATDFVPGTNVRGDVTGANWTFALPSLALGQVVCWGAPLPTTLQALERLADTLTICADEGTNAPETNHAGRAAVEWLACDASGPWPFEPASVDLVYLACPAGLRRWRGEAAFRDEIARVLKPTGHVYAEYWGRRGRAGDLFGRADMALQQLWLTPLTGEMHTAVPIEDAATQHFFLQRGLTSPTLTVHSLKGAAKRLRSGRVRGQPRNGTSAAPGGAASAPDELAPPGMTGLLRRAGQLALQGFSRVEGALHSQAGRLGRYGLLLSQGEISPDAGPPAYLRDSARGAGVDLNSYRWGLWAGGQYSSRKVLFFLFEGEAASPQYLVKMVRAPQFNARLENEARALPLLADLGADNAAGLAPRLVFEGHHHGLALVGETVVDGAPFEQRAALIPECPALRAATEWLTALGAASGAGQRVASEEPARVTALLLDRFRAVYDISEEQHTFLTKQIAALGDDSGDFPVVFQHGDPGTWNMLVTPEGRVAVLDWESAEPDGMPLWDLFYFLRAYVVMASRAGGEHDRLQAYSQHFVESSAFSPLIVDVTRRYCEQVGLATRYVEPLYYTCWMHRALKQATALPPHQLQDGYFFRLLTQSIQRREAPTLSALFAL